MENTLIKDGMFSLSGKKELLRSNVKYELAVVYATETVIERPKKTKAFLFRQEKKHTLKRQIVVDKKSKRILCASGAEGKRNGFKLLVDSKARFKKGACCLADSGYQGIAELYSNVLILFNRT